MLRFQTALLIALALPASLCAQAQTPRSDLHQEAPRTASGRPDFQGVWGWAFLTGMERPHGFKNLVVTPEQAPALVKEIIAHYPVVIDPEFQLQGVRALSVVGGAMRSSLVVTPSDGQLPFTEAALAAMKRVDDRENPGFDDPEERSTSDRCLAGMGQPPIRTLPGFIPLQIVQTKNDLVVMVEDVQGFRDIHLDGAPPPRDVMRTFDGWSAGRWDGDTLVVETTHLRADDPTREYIGRSIMVSPQSRVVERLTFVSRDEILYQFTVEDPALYTQPWLAEFVMHRSDKRTYEYACHEGNYGLVNILKAGRVQDGKPKAN